MAVQPRRPLLIADRVATGDKVIVDIPEPDFVRAVDFGKFLAEKWMRGREEPYAIQCASFALGNLGELALCIHLSVPWLVDTAAAARPVIADKWIVRTRQLPWQPLVVYQDHYRGGIGFVLATPLEPGELPHRMVLHGWVGADAAFVVGTRTRFDAETRPGVIVHQNKFHSMATLP